MDFQSKVHFEETKMEMHLLAYVYRWERDTIWKLRRSERKMWVDLIRKQKEAEKSSF